MNIDQFSVQTTADALYLVVRLDDNAEIDTIAEQILHENCPEFLLPLRIREENGCTTFRYKHSTTIALEYGMNTSMTRQEYLLFGRNLLYPFVNCKDWLLDYHNLCIYPRNILMDKRSGKFLFAYLPLKERLHHDDEIASFLAKILTGIDINNDQSLQIRMLHYFKDNPVVLSELYRIFIDELGQGTSVGDTNMEPIKIKPAPRRIPESEEEKFPKISSEQPEIIRKPERIKKESQEPSANDEVQTTEEWLAEFLGAGGEKKNAINRKKTSAAKEGSKENNGGGWFSLGKKKKEVCMEAERNISAKEISPPPGPIPPTLNIVDTYYDDETVAIARQMEKHYYLELIDSATSELPPKRISLDFKKKYIVLGRKPSNRSMQSSCAVDVAFPSQSAVSRQHLRIYREENMFTVVDLGSTNYTLLDGERLAPNHPYALTNGMILTLAERQPIRYKVHC